MGRNILIISLIGLIIVIFLVISANQSQGFQRITTEYLVIGSSTEELDSATILNRLRNIKKSSLVVKEVQIINTGPITITDETNHTVFSGTLTIVSSKASKIKVLWTPSELQESEE